uniref:CHHC U11-48K-type domain-containing protein n=1 Tax=Anolis carolinensis TaxID=28377 RepID=A0A803TKI8_ANOCA
MKNNSIDLCPYDKNHQIRACMFPYHLVTCCKHHPDIVRKLVMCPFNACHQVPREELCQHIGITFGQNNNRRKVNDNVIHSSWQPPPSEENWDKEMDNPPPSWGSPSSPSSPFLLWGTD